MLQKMGKHKNQAQISIFIAFMEQHDDLAKGFTKRDKPLVESLWRELVESLNSAGPPTKDISGWKKVWTEWKSDVKKKLAHNKAEGRATGGGSFKKHTLNQTEETIVRLCGISQAVEGIPGLSIGLSMDVDETPDEATNDELPSTSKKRADIANNFNPTPKRHKPENISNRLCTFLDSEDDFKKELNKKLQELITIEKENGSSLRRVYRSVEKNSESISKALTELTHSFETVSTHILTTMQEKNKLKRDQLDLEILKFDVDRQKRSET